MGLGGGGISHGIGLGWCGGLELACGFADLFGGGGGVGSVVEEVDECGAGGGVGLGVDEAFAEVGEALDVGQGALGAVGLEEFDEFVQGALGGVAEIEDRQRRIGEERKNSVERVAVFGGAGGAEHAG